MAGCFIDYFHVKELAEDDGLRAVLLYLRVYGVSSGGCGQG
jgi:hypothetical protein